MTSRNLLTMAAVALAGALGACVTTAPAQLVETREAYAVSSSGLAGKLSPTDVYEAKKALDKANHEFAERGETLACLDYTYIARRKVELADAKARTEVDRIKIADAAKAGIVARDLQVKSSQAEVASAREELKDERRESYTERMDDKAVNKELHAVNDAQSKELDKTVTQLDVEKQARVSAEGKLAGAMKDLAAVAAVKEEARGVVITLSGSVLFASGKHALLNTAKTRLDQVAEALKAQDADRVMIVEGHTDSRGSDAVNQPLSLDRANAVRDYLVLRGVAAEKITAVGMGARRPLVDNATPENRANNRRVEIVVTVAGISSR